jgi:hypothetical protein
MYCFAVKAPVCGTITVYQAYPERVCVSERSSIIFMGMCSADSDLNLSGLIRHSDGGA